MPFAPTHSIAHKPIAKSVRSNVCGPRPLPPLFHFGIEASSGTAARTRAFIRSACSAQSSYGVRLGSSVGFDGFAFDGFAFDVADDRARVGVGMNEKGRRRLREFGEMLSLDAYPLPCLLSIRERQGVRVALAKDQRASRRLTTAKGCEGIVERRRRRARLGYP